MRDLLAVWGDSSALRHTSVEQHLYITKALFIGLGFLQESHKEEIREGEGSQDDKQVKFRRMGYFGGKCLTLCKISLSKFQCKVFQYRY